MTQIRRHACRCKIRNELSGRRSRWKNLAEGRGGKKVSGCPWVIRLAGFAMYTSIARANVRASINVRDYRQTHKQTFTFNWWAASLTNGRPSEFRNVSMRSSLFRGSWSSPLRGKNSLSHRNRDRCSGKSLVRWLIGPKPRELLSNRDSMRYTRRTATGNPRKIAAFESTIDSLISLINLDQNSEYAEEFDCLES